MAVLAIIPARAGSKTIRHKNIQLVGGKPLIVHSIEHGLQSGLIDRVIVSTDSEEYADIARSAGAEVPFIRPEEFAQDHSTDLETFRHALQWLKDNEGYDPDICVNLRPTFPLRKIEDIDAVVTLLRDREDLDSVRSVVSALHTPYKMWFTDEDGILKPIIETDIHDAHNLPRQVLPPTYLQNACIDAVRTSVIFEKDSMSGDKIYGYHMEDFFDIDTPQDLRLADEALTLLAK
jgi:CMP-N-acetylneuraminic acid synthetase